MKSMVTFKNVGRLGNFLFEAACAMAYAWNHDLEFTVPTTTNDPKGNPLYLQHLANPKYNPDLPVINIEERQFNYNELPFDERWREDHNIVIHGYRQSEKYFKEYRNEILEAFRLNPTELFFGFVSVHVRRGDYLTIKKMVNGKMMFKHPPVPKEWYLEQMAKFPGFKFAFFSDDIEWCKENFKHDSRCRFSEGQNEIMDLMALSWSEHFICSASTFSWWGAWLSQNPDKRIILPKHWITPGWSKLDFSDVVPAEWERA